MAVVINNNNRPVIIQETKQQIPCNGRFYTVSDYIARLYKEYLLIIPPSVVVYIENMKKNVDDEYKKIKLERGILEEEKKIYEPLFNKLQIDNVKNEKEWRSKVKYKRKYRSIDVLYSFHFNGKEKVKALQRFRESIKSIREQKVRICVCNTSKDCIYDDIKDLANITYYHEYLNLKVYCKPKTINLGVKKLIKTPYFIHSDIDLIYPKKFISEMVKYTEYYTPVRVIFNNYNLGVEYNGKNYSDYKRYFNNHGDESRTICGIAPGNGLIHLKSFKKINGYDEHFIGYGLEDADFNMRIAYINKLITLDNNKVNTCHLYHKGIFKGSCTVVERYKINSTYYQEKRKKLIEKIGNENVNIFNEKYHLDLIKENINGTN